MVYRLAKLTYLGRNYAWLKVEILHNKYPTSAYLARMVRDV